MPNTIFRSKIIAVVLCALLMAVVLFVSVPGQAAFAASSKEYSDVLTDLQKDQSFRASSYPSKPDDYSLKIIQLAESTDRELFVYVYQPCAETLRLPAMNINMSLTEGDEFSASLYSLTLLNYRGVFAKYRVEKFKVSATDEIRTYYVVDISREYVDELDWDISIGQNIQVTSVYPVGEVFYARTENGNVEYGHTTFETIRITKKYTGYLQYPNGFKLYLDRCNSHYIAFDTDRRMDKLKQAKVYYDPKAYSVSYGPGLPGTKTYTELEPVEAELLEGDEGSNTPDGWFAKKYTWQRIETVADFLKNENISPESEKYFDGLKWVLRFAETALTMHGQPFTGTTTEFGTEIEDVRILELTFETDGLTYKMGAVDVMQHQSPDAPPDNDPTKPRLSDWDRFLLGVKNLMSKIFGWNAADIPDWGAILFLVGCCIVLVILFVILIPLMLFIVQGVILLAKGLWWLISMPFKWIYHMIRGD